MSQNCISYIFRESDSEPEKKGDQFILTVNINWCLNEVTDPYPFNKYAILSIILVYLTILHISEAF